MSRKMKKIIAVVLTTVTALVAVVALSGYLALKFWFLPKYNAGLSEGQQITAKDALDIAGQLADKQVIENIKNFDKDSAKDVLTAMIEMDEEMDSEEPADALQTKAVETTPKAGPETPPVQSSEDADTPVKMEENQPEQAVTPATKAPEGIKETETKEDLPDQTKAPESKKTPDAAKPQSTDEKKTKPTLSIDVWGGSMIQTRAIIETKKAEVEEKAKKEEEEKKAKEKAEEKTAVKNPGSNQGTAYERIMAAATKEDIAVGTAILSKVDMGKINSLRSTGKTKELKKYLKSVLTSSEIKTALRLYKKYSHLL